jgi:hypothetical protein
MATVVCIAKVMGQCDEGKDDIIDYRLGGIDRGCWWMPMGEIALRSRCPHKADISKYLVQVDTVEIITKTEKTTFSPFEGKVKSF